MTFPAPYSTELDEPQHPVWQALLVLAEHDPDLKDPDIEDAFNGLAQVWVRVSMGLFASKVKL